MQKHGFMMVLSEIIFFRRAARGWQNIERFDSLTLFLL
jgi:hypothetical protein